jgi:hypothetical protein
MALNRTIEDWHFTNDPANSQVDRVRMLVGDTDENRKLISDSEIEYCISISREEYEAAWHTALAIQAWSATHVSKSGGGYTEQLQKVFEHYGKLAERLLVQAPFAIPKAPQLSRAGRQTMREREDLIQPQFGVGMLSEDAEPIRPNTNDTNPDDAFGD